MDNIDIELLICMVRDRPVLWDKTFEHYKNKDLCVDAWGEICLAFEPDFQTMNLVEKIDLQETLSKKWSNIRDSWLKWTRKLNKKKQVMPYRYSKNLEFLNKPPSTPIDCSQKSNRITSPEMSHMDDSPAVQPNLPAPVHSQSSPSVPVQPHSLPHPTTIKVECPQPSPPSILPPVKKVATDCGSTADNLLNENRHLSFFKSVLPSMACFSDDETLHFQMCVLTAIQNIKRTRRLSQYI